MGALKTKPELWQDQGQKVKSLGSHSCDPEDLNHEQDVQPSTQTLGHLQLEQQPG